MTEIITYLIVAFLMAACVVIARTVGESFN